MMLRRFTSSLRHERSPVALADRSRDEDMSLPAACQDCFRGRMHFDFKIHMLLWFLLSNRRKVATSMPRFNVVALTCAFMNLVRTLLQPSKVLRLIRAVLKNYLAIQAKVQFDH